MTPVSQVPPASCWLVGAGGFSGARLLRDLRGMGWRVLPWYPRLPEGEGGVVVDLDDPSWPGLLADRPLPDLVIHVAARVGWEREDTLSRLWRANVLAPAILGDALARSGGHLILFSAALIARGPVITPDSAPAEGLHPYLASKVWAERLLEASGCRAAFLRLGGIYGLGGPAHLGLNRSLDEARQGRAPVLRGPGTARRNYRYVGDLAELVARIWEERLEGPLLAGGPEPLSIRDTLETIRNRWTPQRPLREEPGQDGPDLLVRTDPRLPAGRSLQEGLKDMEAVAP